MGFKHQTWRRMGWNMKHRFFFHGFTWIIHGFMWKMVFSPCGSNQWTDGKLTPWIHLQPLKLSPRKREWVRMGSILLTTHKVGPFFVTHLMYFNIKMSFPFFLASISGFCHWNHRLPTPAISSIQHEIQDDLHYNAGDKSTFWEIYFLVSQSMFLWRTRFHQFSDWKQFRKLLE